MTHRKIVTQGSPWGEAALHTGWGVGTPDETICELCCLVVARFHNLAATAGMDLGWTPHTAEVTIPIDQDCDPEQAESWRDQAWCEVWDAMVDTDAPGGWPLVRELTAEEQSAFSGERSADLAIWHDGRWCYANKNPTEADPAGYRDAQPIMTQGGEFASLPDRRQPSWRTRPS
jgi:hypothetical protein